MQALATLKVWWNHLTKLEEAMAHSSAFRPHWEMMYWPDQVWVREVLVRLLEVEFEHVPKTRAQDGP
jgi:hypothetical protein